MTENLKNFTKFFRNCLVLVKKTKREVLWASGLESHNIRQSNGTLCVHDGHLSVNRSDHTVYISAIDPLRQHTDISVHMCEQQLYLSCSFNWISIFHDVNAEITSYVYGGSLVHYRYANILPPS